MMKSTVWTVILSILLQALGPPALGVQDPDRGTKRIALVDFRNLTGDSSLDRYQKSVPDQIQTVMARTGRLRLVERGQLETALQELKLGMDAIVDDQTAVRLGRILNANGVITGSYHQEGDQLQFTARVIDVETSEIITGVVERCRIGGDVFSTIDKVAEQLIEQLRLHQWRDVLFQPPPEMAERKKNKKWLFWAGLGAAVIVGGVVVLGGGGNGGETEEAALPDPPIRPGQ